MKKKKSLKINQGKLFFLFISPWLIGLVVFIIGPMLYSLYAAFCDWDGIFAPTFIGVNNFKRMFFSDNRFWNSLSNTMYFVTFSVPLNLIVSLLLAVALNSKYYFRSIYRAMFYLPSVLSGVAIFIVWKNMFNSQIGIFNYLLSIIGIQGPNWLTDPNWSMPSIIIMTVTFCGSMMLIFLAGLQDIPESVIEAAKIDGASALQFFAKITLPLLSPVIFYNLIMSIIGSLQVFSQPWIMTEGGPVESTYVYNMHLYHSAFRYGEMGYAAALAWVLFVIIMGFSLLTIRSSSLWVHSESKEG